MANVLIILAGYPASGKSTFSKYLVTRHPDLCFVTPDVIKEGLWDRFGFDNAEEKQALEPLVWEEFAIELNAALSWGRSTVVDYPFSARQRPILVEAVERYHYRVVTVRFVGDVEEVYKRSLMRDLNQSRHLGHMVNHYHKGDYLEDRTTAEALVTLDVLKERVKSRDYAHFELGDVVDVDATDVTKLDYKAIVDTIESFVGKDF